MTRPLSDKQIIALEESTARINILEGSVRSGKSFIADVAFLQMLRTGPLGEYVICGKSERTVLHNIIEPLQSLTGGVIRYNRGLGEFTLFGRKVYVVGANDERAEGKIRGSTFAGALVDEISIIPETFFRMLLSRLSIPGARLIGTTNTDSPYHWLKTDFIDRAHELDLKVFTFRLEDNPALQADYVNNLKREYQGLWYKRFIEGQWVLAEGAIYDFFDEQYHVSRQAPSYAKYWLLGIDYGTSNAFAAVLVGFNDDVHPSLWVEKEFYWDSKAKGYQKTDAEYMQDLKREFGGYPIRITYIDPSAASMQVELRRNQWAVKQAINDVIDGIRFVATLLTSGDLCVLKSCQHLIKEIQGYVWDSKAVKRGIDQPLKQHDHACDALRYAVYSHYGKRKTLKETQITNETNPMDQLGWGPGWQPV
jgi:PBSX family phage terminase large subunit